METLKIPRDCLWAQSWSQEETLKIYARAEAGDNQAIHTLFSLYQRLQGKVPRKPKASSRVRTRLDLIEKAIQAYRDVDLAIPEDLRVQVENYRNTYAF